MISSAAACRERRVGAYCGAGLGRPMLRGITWVIRLRSRPT